MVVLRREIRIPTTITRNPTGSYCSKIKCTPYRGNLIQPRTQLANQLVSSAAVTQLRRGSGSGEGNSAGT